MINPHDGWHQNCRHVSSPNYDQRPLGAHIELLVIHAITVPSGHFGGTGVEQLFCNCPPHPRYHALRVSAHFYINRAGLLVQFVSCRQRAWHSGVSVWRRRTRCNDFSLGVELEGTDCQTYTHRQYQRLIELIAVLRSTYRSLNAIAGHCHIAPQRKTDPGEAFDWSRLFAAVGPELDGRS